MSYSASVLPEFDQEMASTRKVLERIPDDKLDWQPHPKSHTIGWNANHLADIPNWVVVTLGAPSLGHRADRRGTVPIAEADHPPGDPRPLRPERGRGPRRHRGGDGRGDGTALVAAPGGATALHHAEGDDDPELRPQPLDPPPRDPLRLSPPERHSRSGDVRAVRGRVGTRPPGSFRVARRGSFDGPVGVLAGEHPGIRRR